MDFSKFCLEFYEIATYLGLYINITTFCLLMTLVQCINLCLMVARNIINKNKNHLKTIKICGHNNNCKLYYFILGLILLSLLLLLTLCVLWLVNVYKYLKKQNRGETDTSLFCWFIIFLYNLFIKNMYWYKVWHYNKFINIRFLGFINSITIVVFIVFFWIIIGNNVKAFFVYTSALPFDSMMAQADIIGLSPFLDRDLAERNESRSVFVFDHRKCTCFKHNLYTFLET